MKICTRPRHLQVSLRIVLFRARSSRRSAKPTRLQGFVLDDFQVAKIEAEIVTIPKTTNTMLLKKTCSVLI